MKRWISAGILVLAYSASGQTQQVNKCVTKAGTEYRSGPCDDGVAAKTWSAQVAPRSPEVVANERRLDQIRQESAARSQRARPAPASRGAAIQFSQYEDPDRCAWAKAQRAAAFEAAGHRRTFALSRQMDDLVYESCK